MIFLYDTLSLEIIFSLNTALCITRNGYEERDKSHPLRWRHAIDCLFSEFINMSKEVARVEQVCRHLSLRWDMLGGTERDKSRPFG